MVPLDQKWSLVEAVHLACVLEASAPKVGNVHPGRRFADMHYGHFLASAAAVASVFANCNRCSVGQLALECVQETRQRAGCNTNLGTILLLAPLVKAAETMGLCTQTSVRDRLKMSIQKVLDQLTPQDSRDIYAAICLAKPGGLGSEQHNNVLGPAPADLKEAMGQVARFDAVARQYVTNFEDVFERLLPWLKTELQSTEDPLQAILNLQLRWLAWEPDGLIVRKMGFENAREVQRRSQAVCIALVEPPSDQDDKWQDDSNAQVKSPRSKEEQIAIENFDLFLRQEGGRRNPGTTADLIAATLFCKLIGC
jgi:triphosphoribosyl-dephospho-CoA synthase